MQRGSIEMRRIGAWPKLGTKSQDLLHQSLASPQTFWKCNTQSPLEYPFKQSLPKTLTITLTLRTPFRNRLRNDSHIRQNVLSLPLRHACSFYLAHLIQHKATSPVTTHHHIHGRSVQQSKVKGPWNAKQTCVACGGKKLTRKAVSCYFRSLIHSQKCLWGLV